MEKLKSIQIKYHEKDWEKLNKMREAKDATWDDFIYWAIINSGIRK